MYPLEISVFISNIKQAKPPLPLACPSFAIPIPTARLTHPPGICISSSSSSASCHSPWLDIRSGHCDERRKCVLLGVVCWSRWLESLSAMSETQGAPAHLGGKMHKQLVVKSVKGGRKCFCYEPVSCACGCLCEAFLLSPKFHQRKNRGGGG